MSQLTQNTPPIFEQQTINSLPVAASTTIYYGSAVGDNGSGYVRQLVAGDPFRGFCIASVNNNSPGSFASEATAGTAGALNCQVKPSGLIYASISGVAITDVGSPVYMSDGATFTKTATSNSKVGVIYRFVSTGVAIVKFDAATANAPALPTLTDSTGGTPSATLAAIAAGASYAQADMVAVKNAISQFALMFNNYL